MHTCTAASTGEEYDEARELLREYAAEVGVALCFRDFEGELARLERRYGPPGGAFFLLRSGGRLAGGGALRDLGAGVCEMKRFYLRSAFRGRGLGREFAREILRAARGMGYAAIRLDTLPSMRAAIALYRSMGFVEIPAYGANPVPGALFMELRLREPLGDRAPLPEDV